MKKSEIAAADGLLGDTKITLDIPIGSAVNVILCAVLIMAAYFLMAKFLA